MANNMPFRWVSEPEPKKNKWKPHLLMALTIAVLIFCMILSAR
jgi:hypothetical protein